MLRPYPPGFGIPGPRYVLDPNEEEHAPEYDDTGNPVWRTIWLNELVKLRRATFEQDNSGADPVWYRAMVRSLLVLDLTGRYLLILLIPPGGRCTRCLFTTGTGLCAPTASRRGRRRAYGRGGRRLTFALVSPSSSLSV